jgi:hypothetical protein
MILDLTPRFRACVKIGCQANFGFVFKLKSKHFFKKIELSHSLFIVGYNKHQMQRLFQRNPSDSHDDLN